MKVLLSIKPEHARKIFDGSKKFEFRRIVFKNQHVKTVVVYASSPVKKVIGEFEIERIITDDLDALWEKTKQHAGISKDYFDRYFTEKKQGSAIQIKTAKAYEQPLCLKADFQLLPPQSFVYIP